MSAFEFQIGSTVGDYQVIGILGAGGMGQVYKVRNVISDRVEAMKVLLPDLANQPDLADRFLREIKVQACLEHPNIAALHTAVRQDNQLLMLMEFVEGITLGQKLKDGPLPPAEVVEYAIQVLAALEYAHARGVVHRDIKPANMMLTPTGVVKLMDFGIARSSADHKLTQTGVTVGSVYYMCPEQIQGVTSPDGRWDLYSVGVSLYELLTGKRPFDGDSQFAIMSAHLQGTPIPPVTIDPRLPQLLNDVILMAVAKDPSARFQTAGAFGAALSQVFAHSTVAQTFPEDSRLAGSPISDRYPRKRALWFAAGTTLTAAIVVGFIQFGPKAGILAAPQAGRPAVSLSSPTAQGAGLAAPGATAQTTARQQGRRQVRGSPPGRVAPAPAVGGPASPRRVGAAEETVGGSASQGAPARSLPPSPPTPDHPTTRLELQKAREQLIVTESRASSLRSTIETLKHSQAALGIGLRGDIQVSAGLVGRYLQSADSALTVGDAGSARHYLEMAEPEIKKLERLLGR